MGLFEFSFSQHREALLCRIITTISAHPRQITTVEALLTHRTEYII